MSANNCRLPQPWTFNHVRDFRQLTPIGEAVNVALQKLEKRKHDYQKNGVAYYQPWLVIISDGEPTDVWQSAASASRQLSQNRKLVVLPIGVENADLGKLSQFSSRPAKALQGLKFNEFFEWLSASMSRVSVPACNSHQHRVGTAFKNTHIEAWSDT